MSSIKSVLESARTDSVIISVSEDALYFLSGKDAERYLHGRLTQDVKRLTQSGAPSLLLTPQGKIEGKLFIWKTEGGFLVLGENNPRFIDSLMRFKVADQVDVKIVEKNIYTVQGSKSSDYTTREICGAEHTLTHSRSSFGGFDIACATTIPNALPVSALDIFRIQILEPRFGIDINENSSVADIDASPYVSFTKGCYSGQEVVERHSAKGKSNKFFLAFRSTKAPELNEQLFSDANEVAGQVTTVVPWDTGALCLGFLKASQDSAQIFKFKDGASLSVCNPNDIL